MLKCRSNFIPQKTMGFHCFPMEAMPMEPHCLSRHLLSFKESVVSFESDWAEEQ